MRGVTLIMDGVSVHTGEDLDLVQELKTIGNPTIQSYHVQVPGRNGLLNLTKGLTGNVAYNNRTIQLQYFASGTREELIELLNTINRYHGETIQIVDDDTPDYYYEGECSVSFALKPNYVTISLALDAQPFALRRELTTLYVELSSTSQSVVIHDTDAPVIPIVEVTGSAVIVKDNISYTLSKGSYEITDLILNKGTNIFNVSGSGSVTFVYREAKI